MLPKEIASTKYQGCFHFYWRKPYAAEQQLEQEHLHPETVPYTRYLRFCYVQQCMKQVWNLKWLSSRFNKNVLIKKYGGLNSFHICVLVRMKAELPACGYDSITYCHNCKKSYNIIRAAGNSIKKLYICISQDVINQAR
jgi:hypothetical protein